jgi:hypothetical protein
MTDTILTLRNALLGLASWAIPFVAGLVFYDQTGQLWVDIFLFKSVMIVIGALAGAWLLLRAFRHLRPSFGNGLGLGALWFAINCTLDLAILVGVMGMGAGEWASGIGLRYLVIPIIAAAMGRIGEGA